MQLGEVAVVALTHLTLLVEYCMAVWRWVVILLVRAGSSYYRNENDMVGVWRKMMTVEACGSEKDDDKGQWLILVQAEP